MSSDMNIRNLTDEYEHIPVMLAEVLHQLKLKPGSIVVDCTLGGAGHSSRILNQITPGGTLVGIDQDDVALNAAAITLDLAQRTSDEVLLLKGNFAQMDELLAAAHIPYADAIFMDLGVSSPQIDMAERGFTFKDVGPLDMRMDQNSEKMTAADILATYSEKDLTRILREYGEERWASRIAKFICTARTRKPITHSDELVDIIKAAIPASARRAGGHPAKKTFQALRIEVNKELDVLSEGLESAIRWLAPKGRIAVLTYHSLEDRITKKAFAQAAQGCTCPPDLPVCMCGNEPILKIVTKKALVPTEEEIERNPRARSAKLRVAEKRG